MLMIWYHHQIRYVFECNKMFMLKNKTKTNLHVLLIWLRFSCWVQCLQTTKAKLNNGNYIYIVSKPWSYFIFHHIYMLYGVISSQFFNSSLTLASSFQFVWWMQLPLSFNLCCSSNILFFNKIMWCWSLTYWITPGSCFTSFYFWCSVMLLI